MVRLSEDLPKPVCKESEDLGLTWLEQYFAQQDLHAAFLLLIQNIQNCTTHAFIRNMVANHTFQSDFQIKIEFSQ